ncbi:MAG TPA: segregation/condensation protein A [Acidobacteriota bacterium]|nr:segregation/condensation protein A [Acidobacteriota bacterium]
MTDHIIDNQTDNYRVDLDVFNGPLDLLLYLIKREEVDIYDIPIARITKQYLRYIEMMKTLNLELVGEFILVAATLIRIKTRLLLPRDEAEANEQDPREELIMALVEYRKYKEAGEELREKALEEERVYVPALPVDRIETKRDVSSATTLYELLVAFTDVLSARRSESAHRVNLDDITIEDRIRAVLDLLGSREQATFPELFADNPGRLVAVVTLIAVLELTRTRRIRVFQSVPFAELRVYRGVAFDAPLQGIDLVEVSTPSEQAAMQ